MEESKDLYHSFQARIQHLQDLLARHHKVSIAVFDSDFQALTICSCRLSSCQSRMMDPSSCCSVFLRNVCENVGSKPIVLSCPYGKDFGLAAIGAELNQKPEYYVSIVREGSLKDTDILLSLESDPFMRVEDRMTDFAEILNLITAAMDSSFYLLSKSNMLAGTPVLKTDSEVVLTPREKTIVRLIASGMSNQDIAEHLYISEHTVKAHISNIMKKLGLSNRTQLAIYGLQCS